jgi:hypothetical protein
VAGAVEANWLVMGTTESVAATGARRETTVDGLTTNFMWADIVRLDALSVDTYCAVTAANVVRVRAADVPRVATVLRSKRVAGETFAAIATSSATGRGRRDNGAILAGAVAAHVAGAFIVDGTLPSRTKATVDGLPAIVGLRTAGSGTGNVGRIWNAARLALDRLPAIVGMRTAQAGAGNLDRIRGAANPVAR